ncbi:MAG TPA: serine/threonine-protein kinase [Vicinamibacterales bacterium]|nr:serine/threonine-protein kinase [Vicinamibacterales bacterium]
MTESVSHYNLLERLGEGGLGEVYRARDTKVGRTVALKVLPPGLLADEAQRAAVTSAARAAAALSHPNIATLFDSGEHRGRWYLAYEFVAGTTLRNEMGGRAVNPRRALELAVQIADALADAHARDLVHGDLRPDTIMVTGKGSAKILEFGLSAWTRGGAARAVAAASPDALGSDPLRVAAYLSPEQALGGAIDARSDLFTLGVILYEMLTGRSPFAGATSGATVMNVIRNTPPRPSELNPGLHAELDGIVGRALAKDLDGRYQSAASFAAELRSMAAMLDVRSGEAQADELIPPDEPQGSGRLWLALLLIVALVAVWWYLQR